MLGNAIIIDHSMCDLQSIKTHTKIFDTIDEYTIKIRYSIKVCITYFVIHSVYSLFTHLHTLYKSSLQRNHLNLIRSDHSALVPYLYRLFQHVSPSISGIAC